jgi:tetratricopeptide (TPR) repeat protein
VYLLFAAATVPNHLIAQRPNLNIDSLTTLLQTEKRDSAKARLLLNIGVEYQYQVSKHDSALLYYQKALELSRKHKMPLWQLAAVNRIANVYNFSGRHAEALALSLENLKLAERIKDTTHIFITKREIMFVYGNIGDYQKQLKLAKDLYSFAVSGYFKDPQKVVLYKLIAYNNIGSTYLNLGQVDSALFYMMKMYKEAPGTNLESRVIAANRLAEIYIKTGKLDSAFFTAGSVSQMRLRPDGLIS